MISYIDCAIWAIIGLLVGGIVGWCIGIIVAYSADFEVEDYYPEDKSMEEAEEYDLKAEKRKEKDNGQDVCL